MWAQSQPLPISLLVIVAILVVLHHLVSNNRMKRKKNLHVAQETLLMSLGSLFLSARGLGPHLASVVLGVLGLPYAFSLFAPPVVHSCHCCVMSTIDIHNPPCSFIRWGGGGGLPGGVFHCSGLLVSCFVIPTSWQSVVVVEMRTFDQQTKFPSHIKHTHVASHVSSLTKAKWVLV